jgi:hypothetical protein
MRPSITNSTERPVEAFDQRNGTTRVETVRTVAISYVTPLGQRRDMPDNENWSGRWESNPHGRRFRARKTCSLARLGMPSVISV